MIKSLKEFEIHVKSFLKNLCICNKINTSY